MYEHKSDEDDINFIHLKNLCAWNENLRKTKSPPRALLNISEVKIGNPFIFLFNVENPRKLISVSVADLGEGYGQ